MEDEKEKKKSAVLDLLMFWQAGATEIHFPSLKGYIHGTYIDNFGVAHTQICAWWGLVSLRD